MAYKAEKTEHSGAKHGRGAYWGPKKDAKKESNKLRRKNWKFELKTDHYDRFYIYQRRLTIQQFRANVISQNKLLFPCLSNQNLIV